MTTRMPDRWRAHLSLLARLVLGGALLLAGALKVTDPAQSALAVRAYQLLPYELAGYVGYVLPSVEVLLGAAILAGFLTRWTSLAGGLLMAVYIAGLLSAWARGTCAKPSAKGSTKPQQRVGARGEPNAVERWVVAASGAYASIRHPACGEQPWSRR